MCCANFKPTDATTDSPLYLCRFLRQRRNFVVNFKPTDVITDSLLYNVDFCGNVVISLSISSQLMQQEIHCFIMQIYVAAS